MPDQNELEFNSVGAEGEEDVSAEVRDRVGMAVLWATDWTVETILGQLRRGNILLNPQFQRREAWDEGKKSRFIESLILGFPVPQIVLAESKEKKGAYIVIDGKQRLLSIRRFCANQSDTDFHPFVLKELSIMTDLNGLAYGVLKEDDLTSLQNQTIRTTVIRSWPNENYLYTVFHRLNTGSVPLSPQELRQALHPGQFLLYADTFAIQSTMIKRLLRKSEPDFRMRDVELVIRFFAFRRFLPDYDGNLKEFLDMACKRLNAAWVTDEVSIRDDAARLEQAIATTFDIFGQQHAFRKVSSGEFETRFNRAVYDVMIYYFADIPPAELIPHAAEIKDAFRTLCDNDPNFRKSFESTTKSIRETATRLIKWGEALSNFAPSGLRIPRLVDERILPG